MISYFELLQLIKLGKEPKRIKVHLAGRPREYFAEYDFDDFSHYSLDGESNENYHDYLAECFLESDMFDDKIEILDKKKIEEIELSDWSEITYQENWEQLAKDFNRNCSLFVNKINEIAKYLQEKE